MGTRRGKTGVPVFVIHSQRPEGQQPLVLTTMIYLQPSPGFLLVAVITSGLTTGLIDAAKGANELAKTITGGVVIVDGAYLPGPHLFEVVDETFHVNQKVYSKEDLDLSILAQFPEEHHLKPGLNKKNKRIRLKKHNKTWNDTPLNELCEACVATARLHGVIVLTRGQTPLFLQRSSSGHELLASLLKKPAETSRTDFQPIIAPAFFSEKERQAWTKAIIDFQPTELFQRQIGPRVKAIHNSELTSERISKATLWFNKISYPLTLFAMVAVVIAFGHLLSNKPRLDALSSDPSYTLDPSANLASRKVVLRSLLIFGTLSGIDLVWTLAATATGSMREMNPIGNHLLANPIQLVVFKVIAVSVTITLLYLLHRRPIAQVVSWWGCLVLTLLTARWLTFQSMFM